MQATSSLDTFTLHYEDMKPTVNRGNTIKHLTILKPKRIMKRSKKARKDDKVKANKKQNNILQFGSLALLTIAAVVGITELLGGELKHVAVAALLSALLFVQAWQPKK